MQEPAALKDFNPPSPLCDEDPILPELPESTQSHTLTASESNSHPFHRMSPQTPTLSSLQDMHRVSLPSLDQRPTVDLLAPSKLEDPLQHKTDNEELSFFKDLFTPIELEVEKELLDNFNVGHQDSSNMEAEFAPPVADFMPCDSPSVVDELMDLAGNISASLPPVPEPEPLSVYMPVSLETAIPISAKVSSLASGAVNEHNFPRKLYRLLEDCERNSNYRSIVSWSDDGTSFTVNCKKEFVEFILTSYFDQTQYASFRRQLNMYNFVRQGNNVHVRQPLLCQEP